MRNLNRIFCFTLYTQIKLVARLRSCSTLHRMRKMADPAQSMSDNAGVNVVTLGSRHYAVGDCSFMHEIDLDDLTVKDRV